MNHPPVLPPPMPPPLPYGRAKPRKRRWVRVLVWSTLSVFLATAGVAVVGIVQVVSQANRQGGPFVQFNGGDGRNWGRRSARVQAPVSEVPADLWRISIDIAPQDVETLRGFYWRGRSNGKDRPEVPATVREGVVVLTNVTIHSKGSAGSFRPFDDKPALTLNFSKNASGQKFHGFNKISLNNSVQDPTFVCEQLSRELFEAAGVPVPRADHATVLVNGRDLGLYVVTEGWGKSFLKRYFKDVEGNLYDGGFVRDIDAGLDINSGSDGEGRAELHKLMEAATEPDPAKRWQLLNERLDVDRFASMLALEVMLCHWDGYSLNRNNYRVFHDRSTGRMVFMPHGMDQMFGRGGRMGPSSPIQPQMRGQISHAFMALPAGRRLYLNRMAQLQTNVFVEEKMIGRVRELAAHIRPTLAAYGPELAAEHDAEIEDLCARITQRVRSISGQMVTPKGPIEFSADGTARLSDWKMHPGPLARGPAPRFERGQSEGKMLLRIKASSGGTSGSWRTRVELGPGQYHFEGRVRTVGVDAAGGAVSLRLSGSPRTRVITPDGQWTPLSSTFKIEQEQADVELVCEFDSTTGEAAFDEGSLRLVRDGGL